MDQLIIFDGDVDEAFMDDIKRFMNPILASRKPKNQQKANFLARWDNETGLQTGSAGFETDWLQKFPYASHRINERSSNRIWLSETELSAVSFSTSPNLYADDQVNVFLITGIKY